MELELIIDNCIVSKRHGSQICITPIKLYTKMFPTKNVDAIPVYTLGSRALDNKLLVNGADGLLSFNDLLTQYHNRNAIL